MLKENVTYFIGNKVLSLFFIDEVAKYKQYDAYGEPINGIYADMFEEEYRDVVDKLQTKFGEDEYLKYINAISESSTHAWLFFHRKKGKNGRLYTKR